MVWFGLVWFGAKCAGCSILPLMHHRHNQCRRAVREGHVHMSRLLVVRGANVHLVNQCGLSPLQLADRLRLRAVLDALTTPINYGQEPLASEMSCVEVIMPSQSRLSSHSLISSASQSACLLACLPLCPSLSLSLSLSLSPSLPLSLRSPPPPPLSLTLLHLVGRLFDRCRMLQQHLALPWRPTNQSSKVGLRTPQIDTSCTHF